MAIYEAEVKKPDGKKIEIEVGEETSSSRLRPLGQSIVADIFFLDL